MSSEESQHHHYLQDKPPALSAKPDKASCSPHESGSAAHSLNGQEEPERLIVHSGKETHRRDQTVEGLQDQDTHQDYFQGLAITSSGLGLVSFESDNVGLDRGSNNPEIRSRLHDPSSPLTVASNDVDQAPSRNMGDRLGEHCAQRTPSIKGSTNANPSLIQRPPSLDSDLYGASVRSHPDDQRGSNADVTDPFQDQDGTLSSHKPNLQFESTLPDNAEWCIDEIISKEAGIKRSLASCSPSITADSPSTEAEDSLYALTTNTTGTESSINSRAFVSPWIENHSMSPPTRVAPPIPESL